MLNQEDKKAIKTAIKTLKKNNLLTLPINILKLAEIEGFKVIELKDISYDGAIYSFNGEKNIIINSNQSPTRKRFTIAHELAHWFSRTNDEIFAHRDSNSETHINEIASKILMPDELLDSKLEDVDLSEITPALVWKIASDFNVSFDAAAIRLENYERKNV